MEKIKTRTAGVPIDGRRAAPPDMDHAVRIIEMAKRGYSVSVLSDESYGWYISIGYSPDRLFSNQPEGTTGTLMVSTTHHGEDARLSDDPWPQWVISILSFLKLAAPDNLYVRTGVTTEGATNG